MVGRFIVIIAALAVVLAAEAQVDTSGRGEEVFSASFRTYSHGRANFRELFYFPREGKSMPLDVRIGQQSSLHEFEGAPVLTFYRRRPSPDPEQEFEYYPVASLELEEAGREYLIFITPASQTTDGREFRLAAMPSLYDAIPAGHVAFFNGTGATLMGVIGSQRINLLPGINPPLSARNFDHGEHVLLGLTVQYRDSLEVVLQSNVRFVPNRRTLIVLMPPVREGTLNIVAFRIAEGV